jgi:hypothetical protein
MTEMEILARIDEINHEYSQLPQLKDYDLTLEAIGEDGDVKATLRNGGITFEKTFGITDDLETIVATFGYSEYLTPLSCDLALNGLKMAYFNEYGSLVVERHGKDCPRTVEIFKIKEHQRERVWELLAERLGNRLKS